LVRIEGRALEANDDLPGKLISASSQHRFILVDRYHGPLTIWNPLARPDDFESAIAHVD
jgi:hypothetical protein